MRIKKKQKKRNIQEKLGLQAVPSVNIESKIMLSNQICRKICPQINVETGTEWMTRKKLTMNIEMSYWSTPTIESKKEFPKQKSDLS